MEYLFFPREKKEKKEKVWLISQLPLLGCRGKKNPRTQTQPPLPSQPLFKQLV